MEIDARLIKVCPLPVYPVNHNGKITIEFRTPGRTSGRIELTPEQFKAIELYLCGVLPAPGLITNP